MLKLLSVPSAPAQTKRADVRQASLCRCARAIEKPEKPSNVTRLRLGRRVGFSWLAFARSFRSSLLSWRGLFPPARDIRYSFPCMLPTAGKDSFHLPSIHSPCFCASRCFDRSFSFFKNSRASNVSYSSLEQSGGSYI